MISACIITLNEEKRIQKVIKNIQDYVDEIVVVDGGSTDRTVQYAKKLGAKVFYRKWDDNFGAQRNFSIKKAKGDWIFTIDSDEIASPKLLKKLKKFAQSRICDGYGFLRLNFIDEKIERIEFNKVVFFRRYGYFDKELHETVQGIKNVKNIIDKYLFIIHSKKSIEQYLKLQHYKKIAQKLYKYYRETKNTNLIERYKKSLLEYKDIKLRNLSVDPKKMKQAISKFYHLNNLPNLILGIDIGGTKISFGLVSLTKNRKNSSAIFSYNKIRTPSSRPLIIKTIIDVAKIYKSHYPLIGVAISLACRVDKTGYILDNSAAGGKGWKGNYFKNILKKKLKLTVLISNDAQCFILGENRFGIIKNFKNIVGLMIGTGVGGSIVINKKVYTGNSNTAGEFGYLEKVKVFINNKITDVQCNGKDMIRLYKILTGKIRNTFEIENLAEKGNKEALMVIDWMSLSLSGIISATIHILNPEAIVLGGGMRKIKILIGKTLQILDNRLPNFLKNTKILVSPLNDKANILGAALFFKEKNLKKNFR